MQRRQQRRRRLPPHHCRRVHRRGLLRVKLADQLRRAAHPFRTADNDSVLDAEHSGCLLFILDPQGKRPHLQEKGVGFGRGVQWLLLRVLWGVGVCCAVRCRRDVGDLYTVRDGNELGDGKYSFHPERGDGALQLETVCSCSEGSSQHRHSTLGEAEDHLDQHTDCRPVRFTRNTLLHVYGTRQTGRFAMPCSAVSTHHHLHHRRGSSYVASSLAFPPNLSPIAQHPFRDRRSGQVEPT
mmetsp:Transcript_49078/g.122712  ORF Transcript_49078/g.122712 Transcript_49078/m.122712 type:complete len:239 (+) Transcript_49078:317-1033(+)